MCNILIYENRKRGGDPVMKIFDNFTQTLNQYPFLWILYPILMLLPVVLLVSYCVKIDRKCVYLLVAKLENKPFKSKWPKTVPGYCLQQ
uniref:Uncharacterized protein n=1 Tax=Amphimedon queenslandica TaxID=400682 RepID=A0A1X7THU8_AMPQE